MSITELILISIALAMDAFAVSLTNGITQNNLRIGKMFLIAFFFGFFQMAMPVFGYFSGNLLYGFIIKIAPWLSFVILAMLGIKMIIDALKKEENTIENISLGKLTLQAIATSIDALSVGISFLAIEALGKELPFNILICCLIIGIITFILSLFSVSLGKYFTDAIKKHSSKIKKWTVIVAGLILIGIGIKIVIESFI